MTIALIALGALLGLGMLALMFTSKPFDPASAARGDFALAELPVHHANDLTPRMLLKLSTYWQPPVTVVPRSSARPTLELLLRRIDGDMPVIVFQSPEDPDPNMSFLLNPDRMGAWLHHLNLLREGQRETFLAELAEGELSAEALGAVLDGGKASGAGHWQEEVAELVPRLIEMLERCRASQHVLMLSYRGRVEREKDLQLLNQQVGMRLLRVVPGNVDDYWNILAESKVKPLAALDVPLAPKSPPLLPLLEEASGDELGLAQVAPRLEKESLVGLTWLLEAETLEPSVLPVLEGWYGPRKGELAAALAKQSATAEEHLLQAFTDGERPAGAEPSMELDAVLVGSLMHEMVKETLKTGDAILIQHAPLPPQLIASYALAHRPFEEIKNGLRARLRSDEILHEDADGLALGFACRDDLPYTVTSLEFDMPNALVTVSGADAKRWGKTEEELFELAFANVYAQHPLTPSRDLEDDVCLLFEGSPYVTAWALNVHTDARLVGPGGTAFSIPHRNALLAAPLPTTSADDPRYVEVLGRMEAITADLHTTGKHPVSCVTYLRSPSGEVTLVESTVPDRSKPAAPAEAAASAAPAEAEDDGASADPLVL